MNKFITPPDSLAGLLGCAFWLCVLSGLMAVLFGVLHGIAGGR